MSANKRQMEHNLILIRRMTEVMWLRVE